MIHQAQTDWGIDVSRSYLVGDRSTEIVAGWAAGLYTAPSIMTMTAALAE
jgi:histidinol phosphatase-like enzyme